VGRPTSHELLMTRTPRSRLGATPLLALSLIAAVLSACGGGSGSGGSIDAASGAVEVTLEAGQTRQISGTISTSRFLLKSASWQVSEQSVGAPSLTLTNEKCASVDQADQPIKLPVGTTPEGSGQSKWTCNLGVSAPAVVSTDVTYTLTLTGTDASGATQNVAKTLRLKAGGNNASSKVSAGQDFSVTSGKAAPLACTGPTDSRYQWVVKENQGLPISLSSYNSAVSGFTAPAVTANKKLEFECRVTDAAGTVLSSPVFVTVQPASANVLVARAAVTGTVSPGNTITLNGAATWFDTQGTATTGPVVSYLWQVDPSFQALGVQLLSSGEPSARVFVPSTVNPGNLNVPIAIPVTLTVTGGTSSSSASVNVVVDPYGPLLPVITPAIGTIPDILQQSNPRTTILAVDTGALQTGTTRSYFKWEKITGTDSTGAPLLTAAEYELSSDNAAEVGVYAPTGVSGIAKLRVTVSNFPIETNPSNPSVYTAEVLIVISP